MARRVSWTNNSSGHDGTYVYRAETIDPENLPAPVATVDPVAQGATAEWEDNAGTGDQCYAVQDFEGGSVSALSEAYCYEVPDPFENAQVGDEIGGGIYAGTITYADSREFHLIFAKQEGESEVPDGWGNYTTATGADDPDDGKANQDIVLTNFDNGDSEAFYHCRDYVDGNGNNDYYLPANNELARVDALFDMSHAEFSTSPSSYRWSSTEASSTQAGTRNFSGNSPPAPKDFSSRIARPIRRVPA